MHLVSTSCTTFRYLPEVIVSDTVFTNFRTNGPVIYATIPRVVVVVVVDEIVEVVVVVDETVVLLVDVVDVDVVRVVVDEVLVVTVVVGVWFQTWSTTTDRRTAPLCEITSIVNVSLLRVISIKPYWSSFPPGSGACSDDTPPPPPETTQAVGSKKSV